MFLQSIKGVVTLIRIVPVLSWSFCAIILSVGFAVHDLKGFGSLSWPVVGILLTGSLLLQGIVAHAFNDRTDWQSGTDRHSPGILSGGSKVIPKGLYSDRQLLLVGTLGLIAAAGLGFYLSRVTSNLVWIFIAIGMWSAIAYTTGPLKLAYYPLAGEWLAAFPAMAACSLGTYYVLTGSISISIVWASVIHSLLCTAWLMQHHLSDIDSDLQASPRKLTTPAYVAMRWGKKYTPHVAAAYFLLAAFVSIMATLGVHRIFIFSLVCSLLGALAAWNTNPRNIGNITFNQIKMIAVTIVHTLILFGFEVITY
ncbi:prenyltransferase [Effusibacillus lacus]|uniref:Prenyltransferase n=1 Tax=Effusibacillus lacus TaxID=1348429 RepID=A0A292YI25_9BACL|nr:prenyltransferase [Effusibacillus lacus]TCS74410.1 1,4-dihydroxy-2-naphthoate octaprenyltransferase [Effusibacillus lacus]GAX88716.1 prenyltransferase [Effusibacillus lacus]